MAKTLFKLPIPSSHFIREAELRILPKRECELFWTIEADDGSEHEQVLVFGAVQSFRCTYDGAVPVQVIELAYGKLVELPDSDYLKSVQETLQENRRSLPTALKHLMIYFDDGPCYEFIAATFSFRS